MKLTKQQEKTANEKARQERNERLLSSFFPNRIKRREFVKKMGKIVYMDAYYFEIEQLSGGATLVYQYSVVVYTRNKSRKHHLGVHKMLDTAKKIVLSYNQEHRFQLPEWGTTKHEY